MGRGEGRVELAKKAARWLNAQQPVDDHAGYWKGAEGHMTPDASHRLVPSVMCTALSCKALIEARLSSLSQQLGAAEKWLLKKQEPEGSWRVLGMEDVFATVLVLEALEAIEGLKEGEPPVIPLVEEETAATEPTETSVARRVGTGRDGPPPRVWTQTHCPNCGRDGIEFLSFTEFSRRSGKGRSGKAIHPDTVSRHVRKGRYCADATWQVPWCKTCKKWTPQGKGVTQAVEAPAPDDYQPSEEDKQNMLIWAEDATQKKFPDFDRELMEWRVKDGNPSHEDEAFDVAYEAIAEEMKAKRGELTRDQAKQIGLRAIQDHLNKDIKSRVFESRGKMDESARHLED
jgi:hypothetical protein